MSQIQLGDIAVDIILKKIKNMHLSVHPPMGRVRISAPRRMSMETIRVFVLSKLDWIKKQQKKLQAQERETPREYVDQESHFVWGNRYLLTISESNAPPSIKVNHSQMLLQVRPNTNQDHRKAIIEEWYKEQLRAAVPPLFARWEPLLGVRVKRFFVQRMKTRWGSCNYKAHTIRLNTELVKRPAEHLEYVVVHELVHLLEPTHNARFVALMNQYMPQWKPLRHALKHLPISTGDTL